MERDEFLRHLKAKEDEMRLRTLRLYRIGRLSAPLVAAALLPRERELRFLRNQSGFRKSGYLGFGAAVPPTHFQNR